jgi:tripartite-type tricarboxylate transporter receptor subunit TctC
MVGGTWFGLFAPAGLPVDILTKLREAAKKAETNIKADLEAVGHYPVPGGLEGFDKYIEADLAQWRIDLTRIGETVY